MFRFLIKCKHNWIKVGKKHYESLDGSDKYMIVLYCTLCSKRKEFNKEEAEIELNISKVRNEIIRHSGEDI